MPIIVISRYFLAYVIGFFYIALKKTQQAFRSCHLVTTEWVTTAKRKSHRFCLLRWSLYTSSQTIAFRCLWRLLRAAHGHMPARSRAGEEGRVPPDFLGAEPEPTLARCATGQRTRSRRPERRKTPVALTDPPRLPCSVAPTRRRPRPRGQWPGDFPLLLGFELITS